MTTTDDTRIVALIERAERDTPFCDCGEPMAAIARNGQIWLYCTAHQNPPGGTLSPVPRHRGIHRAHAPAPRRPGVGPAGWLGSGLVGLP